VSYNPNFSFFEIWSGGEKCHFRPLTWFWTSKLMKQDEEDAQGCQTIVCFTVGCWMRCEVYCRNVGCRCHVVYTRARLCIVYDATCLSMWTSCQDNIVGLLDFLLLISGAYN
jgi:hypothetical protein